MIEKKQWRTTQEVLGEAMERNDGWIQKSLFAYRRSWGWHIMTGQCDAGDIWLGYDDEGACFDVEAPNMIAPLPAGPE